MMHHSPRRSPRLNEGQNIAPQVDGSVLDPQPSVGASQAGGRGSEAPASSAQLAASGATRKPKVADLMDRIAELEKELERARSANMERTDPVMSSEVGVGQPPFAIGLTVPNATSVYHAASERPPSWSGSQTVPCTTRINQASPFCATGTTVPAHGFGLQNEVAGGTSVRAPSPGDGAWATSIGGTARWTPRKLPEQPTFGGKPEDWPIFYCAFTETTQAYGCTDLENNQRLLKALKDDARETVKSLLIHPSNANAAVEQLRFRYGRPEQLIRSQLNSIRDVPAITEHNLGKLVAFATHVSNLKAFLQSAKAEQHLGNPMLMEELVAKLPISKRVDWARHAATIQPYPTIVDFSSWLMELANVVCVVANIDGREPKRRLLHASVDREQDEQQESCHRNCPICEGLGQHAVRDCQRFIGATPTERWRLARRHRLCFMCLQSGHMTGSYAASEECPVNGCRRKHHRLLHEENNEGFRRPPQRGGNWRGYNRQAAGPREGVQVNEGAASSVDASATPERNLSCVDEDRERLLFRVLPVTLYGGGKQVDTYALLDEGSSVTMVDNELVAELGVQGISGAGKSSRHVLRNVYAISNLSLPMQSLHRRDVRSVNKDAQLPMKPYVNAVPKLLIGLDHGHLGLPLKTRRFASEGPYAAATELGWVVFGPVEGRRDTPSPRSCLLATSLDDNVERIVEDYFEIENFGVKAAPAAAASDDVRAQKILEDTTVRVGRRYQTGLLWKTDNVVLPRSYDMAYNRLVNIEKKIKRDGQFAQEYSRIVNDYVDKGYARRLERQEIGSESDRTWYLPHFGVENPNKPGKIRLVFDAAARVGGVSLNSALSKGPQHYKALASILFHFREGAVGVCSDIKEMFHQVLIRPEDRCAQRFLWRDGNDQRDPDVYEMCVMTFGAACSPSAAHHGKPVNAKRFLDSDPRAVKAIVDYHYVDDYVDSFATESEAIEVSSRVKKIHAEGGFELCKFSSSSPTVERMLGPSDHAQSIGWGEAEQKILGMRWQPATDDFRFRVKYHKVAPVMSDGKRIATKREFLSMVMSTFDPLGFLCCLMITAKLLLREVWRRKISWDEPLPAEMYNAFMDWRKEMEKVERFRSPRHYFGSGLVKTIEMHVFVDASQSAFASVVYWRITYEDGDVQVRFVCAKTKCAPMRTMTIPRLELQAAVLGTRLMDTVRQDHSVAIAETVLWTDSKTVLRWIGSTHRRYKQFVGNRVAEILESTNVAQWRWLPSADNVADDATRAQRSVDLSEESRWLRGPEFLRRPAGSWPGTAPTDEADAEDEEEMPGEFVLVGASDPFISLERFSSYRRLLRTTAWVLRFIRRCRGQRDELENYGLNVAECDAAEDLLFRRAQREAFPDEVQAAEKGLDVAKGSDICGLAPYLDGNGILRAYGRIDAALCIPYSARRPVILSHRHGLTEMIVRGAHVRMKHQNVDATMAEIRTRFWITRLRRVLRNVISGCSECKLHRARPMPPIMGPLPDYRLDAYGWPFKSTGLDYFGPLLVTVARHQEKRWVALFTCLTTRAIHLELAHDLSTDSCILAIRNFICRRGPVHRLSSDNGRNFVGADREAKRFAEIFEPERIQSELSSKGIEWTFNCPANPSESHTVKEVAPKEHVLESFLIEAENVCGPGSPSHTQ
ncbi:uncharacterized protein LOC123258165 [Drosophila ananassae]|uniref:uncharacterized protein LOC123258165 n=1 Tax=Drosophila ananassae TaxID=7217 RepID=UPI001CFF5DBA|nr:uncharacterized protein LOC123258165 [Drosophila ananassae]